MLDRFKGQKEAISNVINKGQIVDAASHRIPQTGFIGLNEDSNSLLSSDDNSENSLDNESVAIMNVESESNSKNKNVANPNQSGIPASESKIKNNSDATRDRAIMPESEPSLLSTAASGIAGAIGLNAAVGKESPMKQSTPVSANDKQGVLPDQLSSTTLQRSSSGSKGNLSKQNMLSKNKPRGESDVKMSALNPSPNEERPKRNLDSYNISNPPGLAGQSSHPQLQNTGSTNGTVLSKPPQAVAAGASTFRRPYEDTNVFDYGAEKSQNRYPPQQDSSKISDASAAMNQRRPSQRVARGQPRNQSDSYGSRVRMLNTKSPSESVSHNNISNGFAQPEEEVSLLNHSSPVYRDYPMSRSMKQPPHSPSNTSARSDRMSGSESVTGTSYMGMEQTFMGDAQNDYIPAYIPHTVPRYPRYSGYKRYTVLIKQIISLSVTSFIYLGYICIAFMHYINPLQKKRPRSHTDPEFEHRLSGERFSTRTEYYARFHGFRSEDLDVDTKDGYELRVHRISRLGDDVDVQKPGVILFPGFMLTDTSFVVSEERSLAFQLVEQGYDVYLANFRTVWTMPHRTYESADPQYDASALPEAAEYDVPAIIDAVYHQTQRPVAVVGHSEGAAAVFMTLSRGMHPELGEKIAIFAALAPAVYTGMPFAQTGFKWLRRLQSRRWWDILVGYHTLVPITSFLHEFLPGWLHGHSTNVINKYLFDISSNNILPRHIPKLWRTWRPVKAEFMRYYLHDVGPASCVFDETQSQPWFTPQFPPLALFIGSSDSLFPGYPLVDRLRAYERNVRVVKAIDVEGYEHYDFIWGMNASTDIFPLLFNLLDKACFPTDNDTASSVTYDKYSNQGDEKDNLIITTETREDVSFNSDEIHDSLSQNVSSAHKSLHSATQPTGSQDGIRNQNQVNSRGVFPSPRSAHGDQDLSHMYSDHGSYASYENRPI